MSVQTLRIQSALNSNKTDQYVKEHLTADDASWILTNAFLILTMQSGFGLLEAGYVSSKNVANIMVKNIVDVTLGGVSYWMFGYALSFGTPSAWFCGFSGFFFDAAAPADDDEYSNAGSAYVHYVFQFSFATTATTIVSGAIAERVRLHSYNLFSFLNTLVYCFPACWIWNGSGWLHAMGFFDFAGSCVVHTLGGSSALVATLLMGPRLGWSKHDRRTRAMSSPVTALTGAFMLWWAWLGFNCGSTFGVSGGLWRVSSLVAVNTLNASIGGALTGLTLSVVIKRGKYDIGYLLTSILSGLVSITGVAAVTTARESMLIGCVGSTLAIAANEMLVRLGIDDPVGSVPVHFVGGAWGTIAVGLFGRTAYSSYFDLSDGLFHGGGWKQLGVQVLGVLTIVTWSSSITFLMLYALKRTIGLRLSPAEELLGADWIEHDVRSESVVDKIELALKSLSAQQAKANEDKSIVLAPQGKPSVRPMTNGHHSTDQSSKSKFSSLFGGRFKKSHSKTPILAAQQEEQPIERLMSEIKKPTVQIHHHVRTVVGTRVSSKLSDPRFNVQQPPAIVTCLVGDNEAEEECSDEGGAVRCDDVSVLTERTTV